MTWFSLHRALAETGTGTLTPKAQDIVAKNFEMSTGFGVRGINTNEFEVRNKECAPFHVDLMKKTCSCCEFQMLSIPCTNAVAAAIRTKVRVDSLVADEYSNAYWKMA